MKWEADLRHGFFGFTGGTGMRWVAERRGLLPEQQEKLAAAFGTVRDDIGHAFDEVQDVIDAFFRTLDFPEAPPFAGGILDSWPARMVDGLALARREWAAVQSHHEYLFRVEEERRRRG